MRALLSERSCTDEYTFFVTETTFHGIFSGDNLEEFTLIKMAELPEDRFYYLDIEEDTPVDFKMVKHYL